MAIKTYSHLYDTYTEAQAVVTALEAHGVPHSDISLVGRDLDNTATGTRTGAGTTPATGTATGTEAGTGTGTGASLGTIVGGGAGLLAGIGALAIPGVGPVVAAGWLVATLTGAGVGAGAGGLLGSLTGAGVPDKDAHVYAEGVNRGGSLVTVRADETRGADIEALLLSHNPQTLEGRRTAYQADGWKEFDPNGPGYTRPGTTTSDRDREIARNS